MLTLTLMVLAAGANDWSEAAKRDGITVYSRTPEGQNVKEMKAVGMIDAPPKVVWATIRDYANYTKNMPFTQVSQVLKTEQDGKVIHFYSVVNAPLVDKRDYVIRIVDESDWKDGEGFLKTSWQASPEAEKLMPEKKDFVRVKLNNGWWLLEPKENGTKTQATYYLYTDPGGSIPKWLVNQANGSAVPDVFIAIRKVSAVTEKK